MGIRLGALAREPYLTRNSARVVQGFAMSNVVEELRLTDRPTEYEALVAAGPSALDAIPGAVYICDHEGWLIRYNSEAARIWGRAPALGESKERFCGSHRLYLLDGTPLPHDVCPMADAVRRGT